MAYQGTKVPRLVPGVDLTTLPLSPLEGFVLSRIDGLAPLAVLADLTSLDEAQVAHIVERLIELGAAEWVRETVSLPRATGRAATLTPSAPITVPPFLRNASPSPGAQPARVNVPRPIRPSPAEPVGTYKEREAAEDHVDTTRRSVLPSAMPRASHTGTRSPVGELEELEELGTADTMPPPAPEPLAFAELESAEEPASTATAPSEKPAPASSAPEDELDLDPDRQKRIDELYAELDGLDHYRVLGIARDAQREAVRSAYFQLSKVFHPDTMFRKRLGPYKAKMEAIFKRLTEAYDVLGKKRARQDYDRYLALQDRTRAVEATLEDAAPTEAPMSHAEPAPSVASEPPPSPPAEPAPASEPPPSREPSEAARARARELMAKKLRGAARASEARRSHGDERASLPSEPPPAPPPDRGQVLRSLASSIKESAAHTGGLDGAQRHVLSARRAEREGNLAEAARELRIAVAMAPDRDDLRAEHARINGALSSSLATSYEEQALYEQRHGKWAAAALSWAKVVEGRPTDARAARLAAEALVEAKGDLHRAKALAQKAAELEPDDAGNLRALGRVYIAAGLELNARRVLQRAAALDPSDEMVENLLRDLDR